VRADSNPVQDAKVRASFGNRFAEVRIFLGVFIVAAITTTVLGMGGTLGFTGIRQTLGLVPVAEVRQIDWGELRCSVRVDFAQSGWYAVFPAAASDRVEKAAVGYVYEKLLKEERPPDVQVPLVRILP
jgi:hypothetical protein